MRLQRRDCRAVLVAVAALINACTTLPGQTSRIHLVGRSFVEIRLPDDWNLYREWAFPDEVQTVRLFQRGDEVAQLSILSWDDQPLRTRRDPVVLRALAVAVVEAKGLCQTEPMQERSTRHGVAMHCHARDKDVPTVGVVATPHFVAEFAFHATESEPLWRVLDSVRWFRYE